MSKKYPGGLITKTPVAPAGPFQDDAASGVWTLSQAAYWQEQGLWPIAGNSSAVSRKAIFGYGSPSTSVTNLVSDTGVVATDTTGVGTARYDLAAAGYGGDKAIFGYGYSTGYTAVTNKVSNTGVVATDTAGVGTSRYGLAAAGYGIGKAIFGYGVANTNQPTSITNLVSDTGVVSGNVNGIGTPRSQLAATSYGS